MSEFNLALRFLQNFAIRQSWIISLPLCGNLAYDKRGKTFMSKSIMLEKSKDFAVEIVNQCKQIKKDYRESVLTNQLLRCGTSIGANIHESKYAQSKADFISKMQIALKECYESEYWLEILERTGYISNEQFKRLQSNCGSIRRMLISSINTVKANNNI